MSQSNHCSTFRGCAGRQETLTLLSLQVYHVPDTANLGAPSFVCSSQRGLAGPGDSLFGLRLSGEECTSDHDAAKSFDATILIARESLYRGTSLINLVIKLHIDHSIVTDLDVDQILLDSIFIGCISRRYDSLSNFIKFINSKFSQVLICATST